MHLRQRALPLLAALGLTVAALGGGPLPAAVTLAAPAAGFVVNNLGDQPDANLGDPDCETSTPNQCTLRAAIQQANASAGADNITFNVTGSIVLTGTSPVITQSLSIIGPGAALLTVDGNFLGSVLSFNADHPESFYVEGLTLRGGGAASGGGMFVAGSAPMVISATVLTGNVAGIGGGLRQSDEAGSLQLINSAVLTNTAGTRGGGLTISGKAEIVNSRIEDNVVTPLVVQAAAETEPQGVTLSNAGGGIYTSGPLTLTDSLVLGNTVVGATCAAAAEPEGSCAESISPAGSGPYGAGVAVVYTGARLRGSLLAGNYFTVPAGQAAEAATPAGTFQGVGGGLYGVHASLSLVDTRIDDNSAYQGGGLVNVNGDTVLLRVIVSSNTASLGGGGGMLSNSGPLVVLDSRFVGNAAYGGPGGGLLFVSENLQVTNTEFDHNGADLDGGGLLVADAIVTLDRVSAHHNTASSTPLAAAAAALEPQVTFGDGGGLYLSQSIVTVRQSAIYSNTADNGGGIRSSSWLTLTNVTLSGNSATLSGGGLYQDLPPVSNDVAGVAPPIKAYLLHVTVANNLADSDNNASGNGGGIFSAANLTATFTNSLVALNVDLGGEAPACGGAGGFETLGYNLWTQTTNCGIAATTGDQFGVAAGLLPLQDNGGPTLTHGLALDSNALDAANPATCLPNDQRSTPRPFGPGCDIGAFELGGIYIPIVTR